MKFFVASLVSALAVCADLVSATGHDNVHHARGHANVIKHFLGSGKEAAANQTQLAKRFDGAHFTYYAAGLGACGKVNSGSDFIVAMNSPQFAGGSQCFKTITITVNGKSTQASVVDECPGCPYGGLDFSQGLFEFFAPTSVGVLTGSWVFGSGEQPTTTKPSPTPTPTPTPTSTWSPEPTPTSTWSPPPSSSAAPTSTWSPPPSSSSSSTWSPPSSSSSSTSQWKESSTSAEPSSTEANAPASSSAAPSSAAAPASTPTGRLEEMNQVIMAFANLAVAAAKGES